MVKRLALLIFCALPLVAWTKAPDGTGGTVTSIGSSTVSAYENFTAFGEASIGASACAGNAKVRIICNYNNDGAANVCAATVWDCPIGTKSVASAALKAQCTQIQTATVSTLTGVSPDNEAFYGVSASNIVVDVTAGPAAGQQTVVEAQCFGKQK